MIIKNGEIIAINSVKTDNTLTGDGIRQVLGLNTATTIDPIKDNLSELSAFVDDLSASASLIANALLQESEERMEADDFLSAAIDTKQRQLSAGPYIDITSGEDYDTISVTGLNLTTYFAAKYNRRSSTDYFTFDGTTLSANDKVGYFNLAVGYKTNTKNTIVDDYYSATVSINNEIVDTHYINGMLPYENHYFNKNIINDSENNTYHIAIEKDSGINISNMDITCIGFLGEADPISLGVLGTNGNILTFNGNTVLRV